MKPSPSERSSNTPLPEFGDFLTDEVNPALAARHFLQAAKDSLAANFHPSRAIAPLLRQTSDAVDAVLTQLWSEYVGIDTDTALIAVGGYGRGELFPHSDIDVLLLTRTPPSADTAAKLERFVTSLWDTGLQIGHSVRTLAECEALAKEDLTIVTTMMESRHLEGDPTH